MLGRFRCLNTLLKTFSKPPGKHEVPTPYRDDCRYPQLGLDLISFSNYHFFYLPNVEIKTLDCQLGLPILLFVRYFFMYLF